MVSRNLSSLAKLQPGVAGSWKAFFEAVRTSWGLAMQRAIVTMQAEKSGKLDPAEREHYLNKLLGLDGQVEHDAGVKAEFNRMMGGEVEYVSDLAENTPFSLGKSPARAAETLDEAKQAATEFVGKPISNLDDGLTATLSNNTLGKMVSQSAAGKSISPQAHAFSVANLDGLFENAIRTHSGADRNNDPNIAAMHRYFSPILYAGEVLLAKLTVKEFARESEGSRIYSVEAVDVVKPAGNWVASISEDRRNYTPQAGFEEKLQQRIDEVKSPGDASFSLGPALKGFQYKPKKIVEGFMAADFHYEVANDLKLEKGEKVIKSEIYERKLGRNHPLYRISTIENEKHKRYVNVERGTDLAGNGNKVITEFKELTTEEIERLDPINQRAKKQFDEVARAENEKANYGGAEDLFGSFSLGPARVAGILSDNALARITDPRRRTAVMSRISRDFNNMRLQIERMASLAGFRRSKTDMRNEARAREDLAAEEKIAAIHQRYGSLLADEDLVKIKAQPVNAHLADPDSPLRGRLMGKAAAIKGRPEHYQLHRAGDYDGSDGVSRSVFGGTLMPDQAAQELFDHFLIKEPTADAMWEALLREQATVEGYDLNDQATASCNTSGCFSAMAINMRAAPDGSRFFCSQLRRVLRPIPRRPAKASWVRSRDWRTLATSLFASHALADFLRWDSGFTATRENVPSGRFSMRNTLEGVRSPRSSASFFALSPAAPGVLAVALVVAGIAFMVTYV